MGQLPVERVQEPAFAHVGVDCFVPFLVVQERVRVKGYGCIFMYLDVRLGAIHIEVLHSLDTSTLLMWSTSVHSIAESIEHC